MRIRFHLLLLATVVAVPAFLAATLAVEQVREGERQAALRSLRETVRATALLVDGEVQRSLGALTALGNSPTLQQGNLRAFYDEARAIDQPPDVWTLLLDETGAQLLNTRVPYGTPAPPAAAQARVAQVLAAHGPFVSDVFVGPVTKNLLTTIYVPAKASTRGRFVVAQAFSVQHWKNSAMQPEGGAGWVVGVLDRTGHFISRSQAAEERVGTAARPELVAAAANAREGLIRHATLEGVDSYDAFVHSALTGWTIAVAAPVDTIEASATRAVAWLAGGVAAALGVALLGASLLSRALIRAMDTTSAAALALGHGQRPVRRHTSLQEVNVLNDAIADAAVLLNDERTARQAIEQERERLLAAETLARETAQRENVEKDRFIALLGHELRNPLAAIAGATHVLARKRDDAVASQRFLAIIERQSRHLRHIVDDLLEMSRMLSGKIVLSRRPLELAEAVRSGVDALRATELAAARGIEVEVEGQAVWVDGDPVRLEQVVNNLVSNALKFSPAGSTIRVRVAERGGCATIEVRDAGAGMSPELMARVFEPFVQGPVDADRNAAGLGIGLALARQLVGLHGGTIRADSGGAGQGSTFTVSLPAVPAPSPPAPAATASASASASATAMREGVPPCRVLLVEDNVDARQATAEMLRFEGYDVAEAGDGDAALAAASEMRPDAIVMDLGLPGRNGHLVAAAMRRLPALQGVALIALSGYGQSRDRESSIAAGFDEHLVKPADPEALVQAIERLRRRHGDPAPTER